MGVSADRALSPHRRFARRILVGLVTALLVLAVPLGLKLQQTIEEGRPQSIAYPATRAVFRAVTDRIDEEPGMELVFLGRSAKTGMMHVVVGAGKDVDPDLRDELTSIIRREMSIDDLHVNVIALRLAWDD